jgi:hypothetical protein
MARKASAARLVEQRGLSQVRAKIRGIGPKTATAMIAAIGDGAPTSRTADTWQPGWALYHASIRVAIAK